MGRGSRLVRSSIRPDGGLMGIGAAPVGAGLEVAAVPGSPGKILPQTESIRLLWSSEGITWVERPTTAFTLPAVGLQAVAATETRVAAIGRGGEPETGYLWLSPP